MSPVSDGWFDRTIGLLLINGCETLHAPGGWKLAESPGRPRGGPPGSATGAGAVRAEVQEEPPPQEDAAARGDVRKAHEAGFPAEKTMDPLLPDSDSA